MQQNNKRLKKIAKTISDLASAFKFMYINSKVGAKSEKLLVGQTFATFKILKLLLLILFG